MYPHLFSPLRIGELEIKNRIAMAPMAATVAGDEPEIAPNSMQAITVAIGRRTKAA